jgi:hypothetical protein
LREVKVEMNNQSKFLGKTLVVGVILLFIISTIGPVVIGYNVKSDVIIHESSSGKSPAIRWEKRFGGDRAVDEGKSVRQTSDNGYILCGRSNYYNPFGWYDAWLVKTDGNGEMIWEESYGIPDPDGLDSALSVEQTTDGGYIFSGVDADFVGWLCKLDSNGGIEWSEKYPGAERLFSVQQAPDGGYITAGDHPILIKTYPNGTEQWRRTWSFPGFSPATDVDVTDDNGFIITGYFSEDYRAVFLIKVDSNGVEEFKKTFAWEDYNIRAESVEQTSDGGYIILGIAFSGTTLSPLVLIKTDSEGNEIWNRTYYNSFADKLKGREVQQTSDGGYIIIARESDYYVCSWLIKTDVNGNIEWDTILGGFEYNDVGLVSVHQTTDGGFILGGAADEIGSSYLDYYIMKIDMIDDTPPDKPELDGPSSGRIYVKHTFTASTTDPDGDDVYYIFDWSDGSNSGWLGPYKSGEEITASHRWTTFELLDGLIRVRAKDIHNVMSEWSYPIEFTVPRNRITNNLWLLRLLEKIPTLEKLLNLLIK